MKILNWLELKFGLECQGLHRTFLLFFGKQRTGRVYCFVVTKQYIFPAQGGRDLLIVQVE